MDYDLAIFTNIPYSEKKERTAQLELANDLGKLKLCASYDDYSGGLESVILDFLAKVETLSLEVFSNKTVLQVGVYHSLDEAVVFSVRLSSGCMSQLVNRSIDVEISCYPCSD